MTKKRTKEPPIVNGRYRIAVSTLLSPYEFELLEGIRNQYSISRADIQSFGHKYMLELKKDVEGRIMLKDYVVAYRRTSKPYGVIKTTRSKRFPLVYIYGLEKLSTKRFLVFFKENNDPDDLDFKCFSCPEGLFDKNLLEEFPPDIFDAYKEIYCD